MAKINISGRFTCLKLAISHYVKSGTFIQHFYEDIEETPAIIIATETSFRVSDNFQHEPNETVYPNATLIKCRCIRCGHEMVQWKDNDNEIPVLKE